MFRGLEMTIDEMVRRAKESPEALRLFTVPVDNTGSSGARCCWAFRRRKPWHKVQLCTATEQTPHVSYHIA